MNMQAAAPAPAPAPVRDMRHYLRAGLLQLRSLPPLSLYIHLPWCLRKCPYCDFNSHAQKGSVPEQRYVDALIADLESALPLVWGRSVCSVFIGGGTPSLFAPAAIERLLSAVRARLRLAASCEITLEANPGTFEAERFRAFAAAGVTRLSLGVQSFDDRFLQRLGRVHSGAQAHAALREAAQCFAQFNIDLMYALPGQSLADLARDVDAALSFAPPHLSIYHLTIEPNTWFAKHRPAHLPEDDEASAMLDCIGARADAAGLHRYEVSAWARPGAHCAHNRNYWEFGDYLGIGAGAHSKISFAPRIVRQIRLREPQRYMHAALAGNAVARENDVKRADLAFEFMLCALRLRAGFAVQDFMERTGLPWSHIAKPLQTAQAQDLLLCESGRVQASARGFDFLSDLQALFLPD